MANAYTREVGELRRGFSSWHPAVSFAYLCFMLGFSMIFAHPLCRLFSLLGACLWLGCRGEGALLRLARLLVPLMLLAALINPAFSHKGATILLYLPTGNPLTLEAILYGLSMAVLLAAVIAWFACCQRVLSGEKIACLFGKRLPALTLLLTMALGFVPRFQAQFREVSRAQEGIGRGVKEGTKLQRIQNAARIFSILLNWSLENAIETADSMKSRGYGSARRTAFTPYQFSRRDGVWMALVLLLGGAIVILALLGAFSFSYYPFLRGGGATVYTACAFAAYLALCLLPWMTELWEEHAWRSMTFSN